jgi:hypothetical protein
MPNIFNRLIWWGGLLAGAGLILIFLQLGAEVYYQRQIAKGYAGLIVLAIGVGFLVIVLVTYSIAAELGKRVPSPPGNPDGTSSGVKPKPTDGQSSLSTG